MLNYYPDKQAVQAAVSADDPLLILIPFGGDGFIAAPLDAAVEHHILLAKCGMDSRDIDKYYRIVADKSGADWTFVCPPDYMNISDRRRRIIRFYKEGCTAIAGTLAELGYCVGINLKQ